MHLHVGPLLDIYVAMMVVCPGPGNYVLFGHLEQGHTILSSFHGQWITLLLRSIKVVSPTIGVVGLIAAISKHNVV